MDALTDEVTALLQLDAVQGLGLRTLRRLVEEFGSAQAALEAPPHLFRRITGAVPLEGRHDAGTRERVVAGLGEARRLGMHVRCWTDPLYPEAFHHLADPPPVLFLRGRESLLTSPGVTIVGARRATERGRDTAFRLGAALARGGVTVVSGMALGVDGAAHRGALSTSGDTIAVLGRGADRPYPRSHAALFRDILARGLVVSEFLPHTPALPHHFPRRNRLLAGLAHTVVVVEAARRSGSLITVEHALDLGLDVWAVPGPIDQPACEGSNALLTDGARALVSIADFVARVGGAEEPASPVEPPLDGVERSLYRELEAGELHVDRIAAGAGLDVPETLAVLAGLEVRGWVTQGPGLRFRRAG